GEGSALPVGVPIPWPSATLPTGWLKCNGAAFTAAQYPKLAQAYPALKLPDLRGEFIRGWDDGRGVDGGRMLLEGQADSFRSHNHGVTAWDAWDSSVLTPNDREGDLLLSTDNAVWAGGSVNGKSNGKYGTAGNGGNETRPRNIAFNYIVRAA
ncbi:TPA: phage tail protein, partial [Enterobacter roggenkampii]